MYASLNHNIYIVDVDHSEHAFHYIVRPQWLLSGDNPPTLIYVHI